MYACVQRARQHGSQKPELPFNDDLVGGGRGILDLVGGGVGSRDFRFTVGGGDRFSSTRFRWLRMLKGADAESIWTNVRGLSFFVDG